MKHLIQSLKARLGDVQDDRQTARAIRDERRTLARWARRATEDRYGS